MANEIKKIAGKTIINEKLLGTGENAIKLQPSSEASGNNSVAEGNGTIASGPASHAEGGFNTTASGDCSHAEGVATTASGDSSHAEGDSATASGPTSHAEGSFSIAEGNSSHAEGYNTIASGYVSHAEGYHTTASGIYSHVEGKYNISDTNNKYAHIVGNGNDEEYSNAHTLDWDGNAWYQGKVKIGGTSYDDGKELAIFDEVCGNKSVESETASIMVTDHLKEKNIINYQIYGNSVQETRSGKNILPYPPYAEGTKTENDITFTDNGNGTITVNGTASADTTYYFSTALTLTAGTYTFSGCPSEGSDTTYFISGFTGTDIGSGFTVVLDSDTTGSLSITIKSGTTVSNKIFKPQIEVGSVKTDYEQYGAMPSPDFPSEIQSVGDLVTDTSSEHYGKYDVPVTVTGKNLFKPQSEISNIELLNGNISISPFNDGAVAITGTPIPGYYNYISFCYPCDFNNSAAGSNQVNDVIVPQGNSFVFSWERISGTATFDYIILTDSNGGYHGITINYAKGYRLISALDYDVCNIYVRFPHGSTNYTFNDVYRFQVTLGTELLPFEPYVEPITQHIYLDEPLRKVGDYADYIDFKNQKVVRNIKEKVFDGTETFGGAYIATYNRITHPLPHLHLSTSVAMLTRSIWGSTSTIWANSENLAFDVSYYGVATVDEFKTKLAGWYEDGKPLKMYYALGTQTEESIIVPELITPNSTVLNVSVNTDLLPSKINLNYYQDIDIKLSDLENNYATKEYVDNAIVLPIAKTVITNPITVNTIYDLGVQTDLSITLPSGKIGDFIQFDFVSGSTATTLSVTSTNGLIGYDLIPEVNKIYTLYFDWGAAGYDGTDISYGWRFNYSEYSI